MATEARITQIGRTGVEAATLTLAESFADDPVWRWMFETADRPRDAMRGVMRILLAGALLNQSAWHVGEAESVAIWVGPGQSELSAELEDDMTSWIDAAGGETAQRVTGVFEAFEEKHPRAEDHHYLSMYATRPDRRGQGSGAALMRHALAQIDEASLPAYLESSNNANDSLYEHFGFVSLGAIDVPGGCPVPNAFWRDPR